MVQAVVKQAQEYVESKEYLFLAKEKGLMVDHVWDGRFGRSTRLCDTGRRSSKRGPAGISGDWEGNLCHACLSALVTRKDWR